MNVLNFIITINTLKVMYLIAKMSIMYLTLWGLLISLIKYWIYFTIAYSMQLLNRLINNNCWFLIFQIWMFYHHIKVLLIFINCLLCTDIVLNWTVVRGEGLVAGWIRYYWCSCGFNYDQVKKANKYKRKVLGKKIW